MGQARPAALVAAAILAGLTVLLISGCGGGGQKSYSISTDYDGVVFGVATDPYDGEDDVDSDRWIKVFWPDEDYPPPPSFTLAVEKEDSSDDWSAVKTKLRNDFSDPVGGLWVFEPTYDFSSGTFYRIVIRDDDGRREISYFRTSGTAEESSLNATSRSKTGATSGDDGAYEHRIITGR